MSDNYPEIYTSFMYHVLCDDFDKATLVLLQLPERDRYSVGRRFVFQQVIPYVVDTEDLEEVVFYVFRILLGNSVRNVLHERRDMLIENVYDDSEIQEMLGDDSVYRVLRTLEMINSTRHILNLDDLFDKSPAQVQSIYRYIRNTGIHLDVVELYYDADPEFRQLPMFNSVRE